MEAGVSNKTGRPTEINTSMRIGFAGLGRMGRPMARNLIAAGHDVAAAVVFIASDEASFVNGNATYVDNGWYAKG